MGGYPNDGVPLWQLMNTKMGMYNNNETQTPQRVPKYTFFNGSQYSPREMTHSNVQKYLTPPPPPPICAAEIAQGIDPLTHPCFKAGIEQRIAPFMAKVKSGQWMCGGKEELGGHQVIAREVARMLAARPPKKTGDRRGLLVWANTGSGKCHAYDTPILMYDGTIKKVQDISVGDVVMGDDSGPRNVSDLGRGQEAMFNIVPSKGESWGCNESHILVLKFIRHKQITKTKSNTFCLHWHQGNGIFKTKAFKHENDATLFAETISDDLATVEIELKDYLLLGSQLKHTLKMYRTGVDFVQPEEPCFDPYVLGAWLGDGTSRSGQITTADVEIVNELQRRLEPYGMYIKAVAQKYQFSMTGESRALIKALRAHDMIQNKHIPHHIKTGTRDVRLQVLAGLLDTDGYLGGNCYEITQKNKRLADDIVFVARSLGFLATTRSVEKSCMYKGETKTGTYQRVMISGAGLEDIPVVLDRKKAHPRQQIKDVLHYGFKVVPTGWGNYYGFTVDDNHRYLLGDFTVSHNTVTAMGIMAEFWDSGRKIVFCTTLKNKDGNPPEEYAKNCLVFFPEKAGVVFKGIQLPPKPWTTAAYKSGGAFAMWCKTEGAAAIKKRICYHSFWTLGSVDRSGGTGCMAPMAQLLGHQDGSVLIMDESQNLFKPTAAKEVKACKNLAQYLLKAETLHKVIVFPLTATPGDTAGEYVNMLNVVRPMGAPLITTHEFVANPRIAQGLVSYADIRGDRTHYGVISDGTSKGPRNIQVQHASKYFAAMLAAFKGPMWSKEVRDLDKHPGQTKKYFTYSRIGGCILPATAVRPFYSADELSALAAKHQFVKVDNSQALLSEKMMIALKRATTMPGCQYVYVPDAKVLKAATSALMGMGFGLVKTSTHLANGKVTIKTPKPRFYAFHDGVIGGEKATAQDNKAILNFFKGGSNKQGEYLKIFIGTIYEGLDMSYLRGVHLCAPLPTQADDDQAVGRALRYCGHEKEHSTVGVYRYLGMAPKTLDLENVKEAKQKLIDAGLAALAQYDSHGANAYVYANSVRRGKPLEDFKACVQAQAVECGILDAVQFGRKVTCGNNVCPVKLDAKGELIIPPFVRGQGSGARPSRPANRPSRPANRPSRPMPALSGRLRPALSGRLRPVPVKTPVGPPVSTPSTPIMAPPPRVHKHKYAKYIPTHIPSYKHRHHQSALTTPALTTDIPAKKTHHYFPHHSRRMSSFVSRPSRMPSIGGWFTRLFGSAPKRPRAGGSWVDF